MVDLLQRLFGAAETADASDIHLTVDEPPYLRIGGRLVGTMDPRLTEEMIRQAFEPTLKSGALNLYEERGYVDYAYEMQIQRPDGRKRVRYRFHVYKTRGMMTGALRRINLQIPSFEELHLPPVYEKVVTARPKGIIIVGGETGSGKSTTLACMVDYINEHWYKHIVTIEDPIEYVIENRNSKINQREFGEDFGSYPEALRAVVREDPDVIMIGELRDGETVRAAVAAAETGHLVLTSLHTASATEAFDRILYFFPPNEENSVRQNLSSTLIAIMSQMLLPCVDGFAETAGVKRVPGTEVLINTPVVREYIRDKDKEQDLADLLTGELGGDLLGMHDFNFSLKYMADNEMVSRQNTIEASLRPEALRMQFKGLKV